MPRRLIAIRCAMALASNAVTSRVAGVDHVVHVQCVQKYTGATYELDPNPLVIAAGVDRVIFESPAYDAVQPCVDEWMAPSYELSIWPYPYRQVYLWFYGDMSAPQGPFCEPGTRPYSLTLRGSHGDIRGSFDAVIEVTAPGESLEATNIGPSIGVFADPEATSCLLPASPGSHRAYVCVRLDGSTEDTLWGAEFRVAGFPDEWPVTSVRTAAVEWDSGSLENQGVRASIGACVPNSGPVIMLYEIDYEVTQPVVNGTIRVEASQLSQSTHPKVCFCSAGSVHEACVMGGRAYFGETGPCVVGVQGKTWTQVKSVYR